MKKITYYLIIAFILPVILLIPTACNEENIDLPPLAETELAFFTNQDAFERGIRGIYAKLTDFYWFHANNPIHEVWLLPGDDLTTRGDYSFERFAGLQPSNGDLGYFWDTLYELIGRANIMIEKIDNLGEQYYDDPEVMKHNKGEALFLRSWGYYNLYNFFRTAPVLTKRIQGLGEETKPESSAGTELLDQAITDLKEAANLLPVSWEQKFSGRVIKDSAYGLLGRTLMVRAAYNGNNQDYLDAIDAFNNISTRELVPHFGYNFSADHENNAESLFEFQASNTPGFENIWLGNEFNQTIGSMHAYWGFFNDEWSFWAHTPFVPTEKLRDAFEEGDPRIDETFVPNNEEEYNGWEFVKYTKRGENGGNTSSLNNPRILRYADVLLLKAEALVRSGGSTAEAVGILNDIRERARNSVPDTVAVSTVPADLDENETDTDVILDWVKMERFRELAGEESHRWVDIQRWYKLGELNLDNEFFSSLRDDIDFDPDVHLVFPIPTDEVSLNPNITQHEGY